MMCRWGQIVPLLLGPLILFGCSSPVKDFGGAEVTKNTLLGCDNGRAAACGDAAFALQYVADGAPYALRECRLAASGGDVGIDRYAQCIQAWTRLNDYDQADRNFLIAQASGAVASAPSYDEFVKQANPGTTPIPLWLMPLPWGFFAGLALPIAAQSPTVDRTKLLDWTAKSCVLDGTLLNCQIAARLGRGVRPDPNRVRQFESDINNYIQYVRRGWLNNQHGTAELAAEAANSHAQAFAVALGAGAQAVANFSASGGGIQPPPTYQMPVAPNIVAPASNSQPVRSSQQNTSGARDGLHRVPDAMSCLGTGRDNLGHPNFKDLCSTPIVMWVGAAGSAMVNGATLSPGGTPVSFYLPGTLDYAACYQGATALDGRENNWTPAGGRFFCIGP